jgi:hypothetical protein
MDLRFDWGKKGLNLQLLSWEISFPAKGSRLNLNYLSSEYEYKYTSQTQKEKSVSVVESFFQE